MSGQRERDGRVERVAVAVGDAELSLLAGGTGEVVVLIHGIPTGSDLWRGVAVGLATAGMRALAPDLPGYGHTLVPPGGDYSLAGGAALLARWLADTQERPVWLVGHDAGGAVAQILAARHPELVSRLTLTNSIAHGYWPAPRARFARRMSQLGLFRLTARIGLIPNAFIRAQIRRAVSDDAAVETEDLERSLWDTKVSTKQGRAAFERHLRALRARDIRDILAALPALPMPCQLVWGTADPFQPWAGPGRRLEQLLPDPSVTLLDGCGHFTPLECPERLLEAMLSWYGSN